MLDKIGLYLPLLAGEDRPEDARRCWKLGTLFVEQYVLHPLGIDLSQQRLKQVSLGCRWRGFFWRLWWFSGWLVGNNHLRR
jgi:hypothetical protein